MSDLALIIPIAAITIGPIAWAFNNWTRARHGFEPETFRSRRARRDRERNGGDESGLEPDRKIELLSTENERLTGQISRLEERLRVLERIATDPAERTAREIDALREG